MFWKGSASSFSSNLNFLQKIDFPLLRPPRSLSKSTLIGSLAQLVERFVYTEDVGSSSLSRPTTPHPKYVLDSRLGALDLMV